MQEKVVQPRFSRNIQPMAARGQSLEIPSLMNQRAMSVQRFALFSGIPLADCIKIVSTAQEKHFSRRQTIFFEGDPIRHIVFLLSGCVKVTQFGPNGQEVILRLNGPGEMVGMIGLHAKGNHSSTARTVQMATALVWDAAHFEAVSERYPLLRRNTARVLEQRLHELEERFREVSTEKVSPRLSSQLLRLLSQVGKRVNNDDVEIGLSREELAQLTGTTLFTVSRLLSQWELQGIVSNGREMVLVRNVQALMDLSQNG
jgi:CRP/FNR family transcriptional regulator, nitrogen oxide reductase regulator